MSRIKLAVVTALSCLLLTAVGPGQDKKTPAPEKGTADKTQSKADAKTGAEPAAKAAAPAPKKKKAPAPPPIPIELDPYEVLVNVTVPTYSRFDSYARKNLRRDIARRVERTWGAMWNAEVHMNEWILLGNAIEAIEPQAVSDRVGKKYDKVLFLAIDPQSLKITAREWDYRSNSLTVPAHGQTFHMSNAADAAIRLLAEVFQPVAVWRRTDKFDKSYIEVTLKAGDFPAPDPLAEQITPGDVFTPIVRYFNRKNAELVERIQPQPLTYLVVDKIDRELIGGTLISGVPTVFGRNARRAEQFALRKRPRHKSTEVKMVLRTKPDKPLLCHRVKVVSKLKYRDEELAEPVDLISDRYGNVSIPVGSYPTYWIYVYSGKLLLARIPYAPGLVAEETVQMPDDSMRLLVEGELSLLKGRLIDLVAKRAVHLSAALQFSKDGKIPEAKGELAALENLNKVRGLEYFQNQITTFRTPAITRALAARNKVSRGRIERICREMETVLKNYFDPEREKAFRERMDQVLGDNVPDEDEDAQ